MSPTKAVERRASIAKRITIAALVVFGVVVAGGAALLLGFGDASGHALKHLVAAGAPFVVVRMLLARRPARTLATTATTVIRCPIEPGLRYRAMAVPRQYPRWEQQRYVRSA